MTESDLDAPTRHWLSVHQRVRSRIHRSVMLMALLAAVAVVQGFLRLQMLNEDYQLAREFTLQVHKQGPREEAARLYERICRNASPGCKEGRVFVRLEAIPEVGWEYERFLSKNHPSGLINFQGFELDFPSFSLLLLMAPLGLLVVIYLHLRTTAKIATLLRGRAIEQGEVQQCLNSVFADRATTRFGERRRFHATVWALVILALAMTPPLFYVSMQTMLVTNTNVAIDKSGAITPLPTARLDDRTHTRRGDKNLIAIFLMLMLANVGLGWMVWRSVVHQLRPKDEPERETKSASG